MSETLTYNINRKISQDSIFNIINPFAEKFNVELSMDSYSESDYIEEEFNKMVKFEEDIKNVNIELKKTEIIFTSIRNSYIHLDKSELRKKKKNINNILKDEPKLIKTYQKVLRGNFDKRVKRVLEKLVYLYGSLHEHLELIDCILKGKSPNENSKDYSNFMGELLKEANNIEGDMIGTSFSDLKEK